MDMQINAELIRSERQKRAWSQEQLAEVAGLGVRTVQRVESGDAASFETAKALAAVLELSVENLLVETPKLPLWRRPLNLVATASVAVVVLFTSTMLVPAVAATQVEMTTALQVSDKPITQQRLISEDGQSAEFEIDQVLKVTMTPHIIDKDKGLVMINSIVYLWKDGKFEIVANTKVLAENGKNVAIRMAGGQFNLAVRPQIKD